MQIVSVALIALFAVVLGNDHHYGYEGYAYDYKPKHTSYDPAQYYSYYGNDRHDRHDRHDIHDDYNNEHKYGYVGYTYDYDRFYDRPYYGYGKYDYYQYDDYSYRPYYGYDKYDYNQYDDHEVYGYSKHGYHYMPSIFYENYHKPYPVRDYAKHDYYSKPSYGYDRHINYGQKYEDNTDHGYHHNNNNDDDNDNEPVCTNPLLNAWTPDGYCASSWISGLSAPRGLLVVENGDLLVVESGISQVTAIWTNETGHVFSAKLADAPYINHGIAYYEPYLYASSPTTVYRWYYIPGTRSDLGDPETIITGIPGTHHTTRTLLFDYDGLLYVSVGSSSNVDANSTRSRIVTFDLSSLPLTWDNATVFADGTRNEVGIKFDDKGRLWGVENGVDDLNRPDLGGDIHSDNPAEEVNLFVNPGDFYGYPYCWTEYNLPAPYGRGRGTQWAHPIFINDGVHTDDWCNDPENVVKPQWSLAAHQAPLDITFNYGSFPSFPSEGAFVTLHGSWNRDTPAGYKLIYLTYKGGSPVAETDVLRNNGVTANWPNNVRPVNVVVNRCGKRDCLYVSSDASGEIIQISYLGKK